MSFKKADSSHRTDYSVIAKYRNKEQVERLVSAVRKKGKTCYDFCEKINNPNNVDVSPDEWMESFEHTPDFLNDTQFRWIFEKDLDGLKNAEKVIVLLPAGNSVHIEAGIAYGLGKPLILIGKPEKPESLYLIFEERYDTMDEFLATL
jgi:nucleoside 2-deoxyribosyltransferase